MPDTDTDTVWIVRYIPLREGRGGVVAIHDTRLSALADIHDKPPEEVPYEYGEQAIPDHPTLPRRGDGRDTCDYLTFGNSMYVVYEYPLDQA